MKAEAWKSKWTMKLPRTVAPPEIRMVPPSDKAQATKEFVERVNKLRQARQIAPLSWNTAVKFLMARKFDVHRAVSLYEQHEETRLREGLTQLNPSKDPLKAELSTGKFTILPGRDSSGSAIAVFTARLHDPRQATHQTTLQGVVYQLDAALESTQTQRCGLVFVYDMTDSVYQNFDYQLSQKILNLLKGGYPARLKKVLIVTAPLWFKAPFKVLRLFVREKLRDRVFTVSSPELVNHIPADCLPSSLGGSLQIDHSAWLLHCVKSMTNRHPPELCDVAPLGEVPPAALQVGEEAGNHISSMVPTDTHTITEQQVCLDCSDDDHSSYEKSLLNESHDDEDDLEQHLSQEQQNLSDEEGNVEEDDEIEKVTSSTVAAVKGLTENSQDEVPHINGHVSQSTEDDVHLIGGSSPVAPPSSGSSGFSDDDSLHYDDGGGFSLEEFVLHLRHKSRQGLYQDYSQIKTRPAEGTFDNSRQRCNQIKNRYTDVLCFDHSRVVLCTEDEDPQTDYINANFVDGYKQKNAFISTQGPLPSTFGDFWRMIWEQHVCVVVMTTRVVERGRTKCGQYWPVAQGATATHQHYTITNTLLQQFRDYTMAQLSVVDNRTGEERKVEHLQFTAWPDYGVPESALAMLDFLTHVRESQTRLTSALGDTWTGHSLGPPIVVHCSAGIGRTGTFCTLDICIKRLEDVKSIDVKGTVEKIRSQRAFSIQMPDQYVFCHLALLEYALNTNKLNEVDLTGFEEDGSDSE